MILICLIFINFPLLTWKFSIWKGDSNSIHFIASGWGYQYIKFRLTIIKIFLNSREGELQKLQKRSQNILPTLAWKISLRFLQKHPAEAWRRATFLKREYSTGVFLWNLRNFKEHLFWRLSASGCFCFCYFEKPENSKNILMKMVKFFEKPCPTEIWQYLHQIKAVVCRCSSISQISQENTCIGVSF